MPTGFTPLRNSFHETLLGLEYPAGLNADIFSSACVASFTESEFTKFGYVFTQVFEPDVLREVALLADVPYGSLTELHHQPTWALRRLAELVRDSSALTVVELVNVASALISVSRFDVATRLLDTASDRVTTSRERFEIAWLRFLVSNRRDDGGQSPAAFEAMRAEIDMGAIPTVRVLDACTQAVVWYLKRREVPMETFTWSVRTGQRLVVSPGRRLDAGTVSSWFRGVAMVPAAQGASGTTRRYMQRARDAAEEKMAENPSPAAMNLVKTYYESSLKEQAFVNRDLDAALAAGQALIDLDPVWAPSYGEVAEVYEKFGKLDEAARFYERAAQTGPPYIGHHLTCAARCRTALGQHDTALDHYSALLEMAPGNETIRIAGQALVDQVCQEARARFDQAAGAAVEPRSGILF